jgi:site-specific recombinase XerC
MSKSVNHREREYLNTNEVEKLLAASKEVLRNPVRDYEILLLMYRHGLWVSELCQLKLSDINLELGEIYVNRLRGSNAGPHPMYNGEGAAIRAWLVEREARGQGQNRVQAIQGLDGTLCVDAEDRRVQRWLEVKANDIGCLVFKLLGAGHIAPKSMGLNACGGTFDVAPTTTLTVSGTIGG